MKAIKKTLAVLVVTASAMSCTNVGDFSTGPGECYEGSIIEDADYIRSASFARDLNITLTLDVEALQECFLGSESEKDKSLECSMGALITTDDQPPTFTNAVVRPIKQIPHDSLSLFSFPGGRIHNFITYVSPNEGPPAMAIISLMENNQVEVRIIRPPNSFGDPDLFGVFRLVRKEGCLGEGRDV